MKNHIIIFCNLMITITTLGQNLPSEYFTLIKKADSLYEIRKYTESAFAYSCAFKTGGSNINPDDRYNAACSWALANSPDSAFFHLEFLATKEHYADIDHITTDADLNSLHNDQQWKSLLVIIKKNKEKEDVSLNKPLANHLDSILTEDTKYRMMIEDTIKKYGYNSKEMGEMVKIINEKDSINLIKIKAFLGKYGWLGPDKIGKKGSAALFLVIQHSDQKTQEKYLPMLREAVKAEKASPSHLALLEDRIAIGQGKKQIYGSQIGRDQQTGQYYVLPLEDPDNVDKRRTEIGLQPLTMYLTKWKIQWDPEQYKKQLIEIEKK